jgi:adenosine deaminase
MLRLYGLLLCAVFLASALPTLAQSPLSDENWTAAYLESVRNDPTQLQMLLQGMPKGGDLHLHLEGSVYAESIIGYALEDHLCLSPVSFVLTRPPCADDSVPLDKALNNDSALREKLIDAYSMRDWSPGIDSAQEHFFRSFDKFIEATRQHQPEEIAEIRSRAASASVQYVEIMWTPDEGEAIRDAANINQETDPQEMERVLDLNIRSLVEKTRHHIDATDAAVRKLLQCDGPNPQPGCNVRTRYIYQALRGFSRPQVFAQLLLAFRLSKEDPRVVGVNLVMPEHWDIPLADFNEHLRYVHYLHQKYPSIHISLHAGELRAGLVTPENLNFHIRSSMELGMAERIGHGVSLAYERDPQQLLIEMASRRILVEICLTSNTLILGVHGSQHPLKLYMRYGVPISLATDDQGVSRATMTSEYLRAVQDQGLGYRDLKRFARESLEHAFLPGHSLWLDKDFHLVIHECRSSRITVSSPTTECAAYLASNERASAQWALEESFRKFEQEYRPNRMKQSNNRPE